MENTNLSKLIKDISILMKINNEINTVKTTKISNPLDELLVKKAND